MFVVTLVASVTGAGIPSGSLGQIGETIGVDPIRTEWLQEDRAVDLFFDLPSAEPFRNPLRARTAQANFDCLVQPADGRRKNLLLADMDSTMIGQECIDELADVVGVKEKVSAITASAMRGEIAFEPALKERVALLRGLSTDVVDKVVRDRISLAPGGRTLVATMRANGAYTALVSGGFTVFTEKIAAMLGFDEHRANELLVEEGRFAGRVAEPILGADAKLAALKELTVQRSIEAGDTLAVGDGANDLPMILAAGTGVALHAKPAVAAKARHRVDHGDLTALLFMQGYRVTDFVD